MSEPLRRAAAEIRRDQAYSPGHGDRFELAVADWLHSEAAKWDQVFEVTQQPSRGVDEPPAVHYGDPKAAARVADFHTGHALAVARAYLKEA